MTKQLISQFYSSDLDSKREAIYRVLFDRRHDLLAELKKAVPFEKNEQVAVFMVQVCLTLEAFPRDYSAERRILEVLQKGTGAGDLQPAMWKYLETHGSSQMLVATLGAMGEAIPPDAQDFIEVCLNHPDPEVRAMACEKAIKSGRPTHFAYVLNLITDADPFVAQTAFGAIHNMPVNELAIVLDYALGSPDEWVLKNVAPFLPNLINNGLRQVIAKVQYHKHPLVSRKAREALKTLDAIPYVSKRSKKDDEVGEVASHATAESESGTPPDQADTVEHVAIPAASFKEQMELKRQQKMEDERLRKVEEEAFAKELASVKPDEIASFASELEDFAAIANGSAANSEVSDGLPADEQVFSENTSFEAEAAMLDDIDENMVVIEEGALPADTTDEIDFEKASEEQQPEIQVKTSSQFQPALAAVEDSAVKLTSPGLIEKTEVAKTVSASYTDLKPEKPHLTIALETTPVSPEVQQTAKTKQTLQKSQDLITPATPVTITPATSAAPAITTTTTVKAASASTAVEATAKSVRPPTTQILPAIPAAAREIIARYPSFLSDPFALLFKPARPDARLKIISQVVDNLTAFLNLCFLQSCLYFAPESDGLTRSVKECLKGHLVGPTAFRCLHNFALSMKAARGSPVFFTFSLAGIFGESSDTNPLMMMRELKEYLRDPATPLEESVPQAIDGLTEILKGVKSILNNSLVMKAPKGAKEPFADLSGPEATILALNKRPALDLPVGEVVLISRDGNEALGLFPYFKYANRKVLCARPDERETATLYERLEIPTE